MYVNTLGRRMADSLPLYARCPRCLGGRFVTAFTEPSNGFTPMRSESFTCPVCHGTGEADMEAIIEAAEADNERFDDEHFDQPQRGKHEE